jgi:hypothetical protein
MSFEDFMSQMLRPTFVWRMASAKLPIGYRETDGRKIPDDMVTPYVRGARTSAAKARRQIDDLVLQRALVIADERRCASLYTRTAPLNHPQPAPARCEYQRGHGPVPGRRGNSTGTVMHDRKYDHAAPSLGIWWMSPEEAHA